MPKYMVIGIVDAATYEEIEAETPAQAIEKAQLHASVCHQCSNELEVGGIAAVRVLDEDGEQVYTDEVSDLYYATIEELEAEIERRKRRDDYL